MRLALVLALIGSAALGQGRVFERPQEITYRRTDRGQTNAGTARPFFEFAPADGAGMGSACACTTPTGAKGEALTFTRASTGYCTKGNETSGIVNGDLVECSTNQPRIEPGGDGTGGLGIASWKTQTNSFLRSQQFDNAAWSTVGANGAAAPTVTADYAISPDGTQNAERVQFPSTIGLATGVTLIYQPGCLQTVCSAAVYLKGTSGSGHVSMLVKDVAPYTFVECAFNATTWTRCKSENYSGAAGAGNVYWGADPNAVGGTQYPAIDVLMWQADSQSDMSVGPPIKTTTTSATRSPEVAELDLGASAPAANLFSAAATRSSTWPDSTMPVTAAYLAASKISFTDVSFAGWTLNSTSAGVQKARAFNDAAGAFGTGTANGVADSSAGVRWSSWSSGVLNSIYNGTSLTVSASQTGVYSPARYLMIGQLGRSATYVTNGVIKRVCVDPSPARCR